MMFNDYRFFTVYLFLCILKYDLSFKIMKKRIHLLPLLLFNLITNNVLNVFFIVSLEQIDVLTGTFVYEVDLAQNRFSLINATTPHYRFINRGLQERN